MRARNLKPGIFRNELLAVANPLYTVIFEGLWCLADREGRLEDRPAKIHLNINPGRSFESTTESLDWLTANDFIVRYQVAGAAYIQIVNFSKHQNPHCREPGSTIPAPDQHSAGTVPARLTPDSPFLIPDSPNRASATGVVLHASLPEKAWKDWLAYRKRKRLDCDPAVLQLQLDELAPHDTETQARMLAISIQAGWSGVFEPRANGKANGHGPPKRKKPATPEEIAEARRKAAEDNHRQVASLGLAGALKAVPQ